MEEENTIRPGEWTANGIAILTVDKEVWLKEAAEIEEHYKKFGDRLPQELVNQLNSLKANLA